ncbi:hypothetical protein ETD83_39425 [Actinomadura soli]|uniref:Uncharacterized protein n=1 Tax=Actinomadura soli TaxID=2508997 RepID=A0A5C4IZ32_9ACTN|nr:hypothetical protein [Actinomadura soli]TMQ89007.1 hypothetical protein ETD83_39425 [Actinomadura soli]
MLEGPTGVTSEAAAVRETASTCNRTLYALAQGEHDALGRFTQQRQDYRARLRSFTEAAGQVMGNQPPATEP